jgi:hypothetical protein
LCVGFCWLRSAVWFCSYLGACSYLGFCSYLGIACAIVGLASGEGLHRLRLPDEQTVARSCRTSGPLKLNRSGLIGSGGDCKDMLACMPPLVPDRHP